MKNNLNGRSIKLPFALKSIVVLTIFLLSIASHSQGIKGLNLLEPTPNKSIDNISSESRKVKALILECLSYCKRDNDVEYEEYRLLDCSDSTSRTAHSKRCSGVNLEITIYYIKTNRFGEKSEFSNYCTWSGHDYTISSDCRRSTKIR